MILSCEKRIIWFQGRTRWNAEQSNTGKQNPWQLDRLNRNEIERVTVKLVTVEVSLIQKSNQNRLLTSNTFTFDNSLKLIWETWINCGNFIHFYSFIVIARNSYSTLTTHSWTFLFFRGLVEICICICCVYISLCNSNTNLFWWYL